MGGFEDDCLAAHNKYRKKHGVPTLKYNRQVASIAQVSRRNEIRHWSKTATHRSCAVPHRSI